MCALPPSQDFVLLKTVGKGSFGKVVQVRGERMSKFFSARARCGVPCAVWGPE
jgi:hypothetical protein